MSTRIYLILIGILVGAILLSLVITSCQAPQVCKNCWVAGG